MPRTKDETTIDLRDFVSVDPVFIPDGRIILHGRYGEVYVVSVLRMDVYWKDPETKKDMTRCVWLDRRGNVTEYELDRRGGMP